MLISVCVLMVSNLNKLMVLQTWSRGLLTAGRLKLVYFLTKAITKQQQSKEIIMYKKAGAAKSAKMMDKPMKKMKGKTKK